MSDDPVPFKSPLGKHGWKFRKRQTILFYDTAFQMSFEDYFTPSLQLKVFLFVYYNIYVSKKKSP